MGWKEGDGFESKVMMKNICDMCFVLTLRERKVLTYKGLRRRHCYVIRYRNKINNILGLAGKIVNGAGDLISQIILIFP